MKTPLQLLLPALAAALLGSGCVAPQYDNRIVEFVDPPRSDYYTGAVPDFSIRQSPYRNGRKFRVANLLVATGNVELSPDAKTGMEDLVRENFANYYMRIRRQAADSPARKSMTPRIFNATRSVVVSFNAYYAENTAKLIANSQNPRMKYSIAAPVDQSFLNGYGTKRWIREVNDELIRRHPNLFSDDETAFPVDIVMGMLYDGNGRQRSRSLYEAWLVGLPEHANITPEDCYKNGGIFQAEQGYCDPYDTIAAALFKVNSSQLDWIEPANPEDYEWIYDGSIRTVNFQQALGEYEEAQKENALQILQDALKRKD